MFELQGGDATVIDDPGRLPHAKYRTEIASTKAGYVSAMDCEEIGVTSVLLGGGRKHESDLVDHAVGIVMHKKIGDEVRAGEALCTVHYNSEERMERAREMLARTFRIADECPERRGGIVRRVLRAT